MTMGFVLAYIFGAVTFFLGARFGAWLYSIGIKNEKPSFDNIPIVKKKFFTPGAKRKPIFNDDQKAYLAEKNSS